jgi:acetyl esterase/lipase
MKHATIHRRSFLTGFGALLASRRFAAASKMRSIRLWDRIPGPPGGPVGPEEIQPNGAVRNIAEPHVEVAMPSAPNGATVLIAAGGGYKRIEIDNEARPAARWLSQRGVTAFTLSYRLPIEGWPAGPLAPLQDAQRAIRLVRHHAAGMGLDTTRIGVLGFSAGGHLMGLASSRFDFPSYEPADELDALSSRPDASALIYPIITLEPPYDQTSTRRSLVGPHPSLQQSKDWSVETWTNPSCPPFFLCQAIDDQVSDPKNTIIIADACRQQNVPVELERLAGGGHGFDMGRAGTPSDHWTLKFDRWLAAQGFLAT